MNPGRFFCLDKTKARLRNSRPGLRHLQEDFVDELQLFQLFHAFDKAVDLVDIELDEHDVSVQQHMRDDRRDDAFCFW